MLATVAVSALAAGLVALLVHGLFKPRESPSRAVSPPGPSTEAVFLFEGELLIDANEPAFRWLAPGHSSGSDWKRLLSRLGEVIPTLGDGEDLEALGPGESLSRSSEDGLHRLVASRIDSIIRIELSGDHPGGSADEKDGGRQSPGFDELSLLRDIAGTAPVLMWISNDSGAIVWANAAYLSAASAMAGLEGKTPSWPPDPLFRNLDSLPKDRKGRVILQFPGGRKRHYAVTSVGSGRGENGFAIPADDAAHAETTLRDFIQTLSKTFAHLPTGIAIFDSNRRLILFNPALLDLFALPADILASRPTLADFFDRLRESRMIPEPKNYALWRQEMSDLQASAKNGTYEETWALGTGQTFRVIGRPHPGGAVAFLFEDITAEISVTRRFRAELALEQEVLDHLGFGVAVFSETGKLTICNRPYSELWGPDQLTPFASLNLREAMSIWAQGAQLPGFAERAEAAILSAREGCTVAEPLCARNGRRVEARFQTLSGGAVMATFHETPVEPGARRYLLRQASGANRKPLIPAASGKARAEE